MFPARTSGNRPAPLNENSIRLAVRSRNVSGEPRYGYTIISGAIGTHVLNGALYSLRYDLLDDFAPIAPVATSPFVLFARATMPARSVTELVAWLKANRDKASAGIIGPGPRLFTVFFQQQTGTRFTVVPHRFKGCVHRLPRVIRKPGN
jgi:tripartite-type tricarboxylate transporter receptor subunit TctC